MNKRFFVAALALLAATSINARQTNAQTCPNSATFGVHTTLPVNTNLQSQIEVTYFTTDDPNAFISERAGIKRSASYTSLDTLEFVAKIEKLERDGVARIRKQQSATSFLGAIAQLNLERHPVNADAKMFTAGFVSPNSTEINALDRKTEVSISKGSSIDGDYYRVGLLSWFMSGAMNANQKFVDYDANILMKPGQTAVFKLLSDSELKRSGAPRSYIALTMRSVNNVAQASLQPQRSVAIAAR